MMLDDVTVLNPEQKTSFLPTQLLTHRTELVRKPVRNQPSGLFFLDLPHLNSPPNTPSLLLWNGRGRGGRAPRMSPLTASSGWRLEVRAPFLPASPRPYRPGLGHHHRQRQGFLRTSETARPTLACSAPRAGLAAQARGRWGHRAAPRTLELRRAASPPPPLRSAASRRRPRANLAGEEEATRD